MDDRVQKALDEQRLSHHRLKMGENYLPCPHCSHKRKKPKSPCLKLGATNRWITTSMGLRGRGTPSLNIAQTISIRQSWYR
jgi:hypothetical protein